MLNQNNTKSKTSTTFSRTLIAFVVGAVLTLILSYAFMVPTARSEESAPPPRTEPSSAPTAYELQVARQFGWTKYRQRRADFWIHKMGRHDIRAHRVLQPVESLRTETQRTFYWRNRADVARAAWRTTLRRLTACRQAGFPRWYCPVLIKAASARGVPRWSGSRDLVFIINKESTFNPRADNPRSTAYGLFQLLTERSSDPYVQSLHGIDYIVGRYGSPAAAVRFWNQNHWY